MDDPLSEAQIEETFLQVLEPGGYAIKTAMLIARSFRADELPSWDLINAGLLRLAAREDIKTHGDIQQWRWSEIQRLAEVRPSKNS
ncbi:MAG: hypothetical protein AAFQ64_12330 [Pseudomonadota bacterium]